MSVLCMVISKKEMVNFIKANPKKQGKKCDLSSDLYLKS